MLGLLSVIPPDDVLHDPFEDEEAGREAEVEVVGEALVGDLEGLSVERARGVPCLGDGDVVHVVDAILVFHAYLLDELLFA